MEAARALTDSLLFVRAQLSARRRTIKRNLASSVSFGERRDLVNLSALIIVRSESFIVARARNSHVRHSLAMALLIYLAKLARHIIPRRYPSLVCSAHPRCSGVLHRL